MKMTLEAPTPRLHIPPAAAPAAPTISAVRKAGAIAFITLFVGVFWYVAGGTAVMEGHWMEFLCLLPMILVVTALESVWWWHVFFKSDPEP